jgi:hypothetical protein
VIVAPRPLLPLLALLLVALVPVAYHAYGDANHDDCADPAGLLASYQIPGTQDDNERWDKHVNGWIQWTEGNLQVGRRSTDPLIFRIVRSFHGRRVYLSPTGFIPGKLEPDDNVVEWLDVDGERVPIHVGSVFEHSRQAMMLVAYMFAYGNEPVAHPFRAQLASAIPEIFEGSRPVTLFIVSGFAPRERLKATEATAREWLAGAWRLYRSSCVE